MHLEEADGEAVWWANSPDLPGFTAAAPSLADLRELVREGLGDTPVTERLDAPVIGGVRTVGLLLLA